MIDKINDIFIYVSSRKLPLIIRNSNSIIEGLFIEKKQLSYAKWNKRTNKLVRTTELDFGLLNKLNLDSLIVFNNKIKILTIIDFWKRIYNLTYEDLNYYWKVCIFYKHPVIFNLSISFSFNDWKNMRPDLLPDLRTEYLKIMRSKIYKDYNPDEDFDL